MMLLSYLLATLVPATSSLPTNAEQYNCGYVLTAHNSSSYAGVYAYEECKPIYFNQTIQDFQDAYAYHIFGGCQCKFFGSAKTCVYDEETPVYKGPMEENEVMYFEDPKPTWYNCVTSH